MSSKLPAAFVVAAAALLAVPGAASAQVPQCATQGPVGLAYATGVNCRTLELDGHQRRFEVYMPATVQNRAPVVFMFHGSSGTGEQFLAHSGWREQADANGLIAVFPTGLRYRMEDTGRLTTKWADYDLEEDIVEEETPPADDVAFVDAMLADLLAREPIDTHRIYASGFSNGAGFTARLSVERSQTFAAVGFSGGGLSELHTPSRPVPTYSTIGSLDPKILDNLDPPLSELPLNPAEFLTHPTIDAHFDIQLDALGLDHDLYGVIAGPDSTSSRWPATGTGPGGALFRFTLLEGLRHSYPDDAAARFAAFFAEHRLP